MSQHPLNLILRFLLELAALAGLGYWGWRAPEGPMRFVLPIVVVVGAAAIWGVFRPTLDPGGSGAPPVTVPGWVRLLIEIGFFAAAVLALWSIDAGRPALILGALTLIHYGLGYDRVARLLRS